MTKEELIGYIQAAVPFLEEAWTACFKGQESALLSCEQRGMRMLLAQFRLIAKGERCVPTDTILRSEAAKQTENAIAWAHKLLGSPSELKPELQRWVRLGETCADGLVRANARVEELEENLREQSESFDKV